MKIVALVVFSCALWEANSYPYYPYYGNMDTLSYGASDSSRGGMVLSRYYNPYYNPRAGGGMAAFMYKPEEAQSQYYLPDRRQQIPQEPSPFVPPQENEVIPSQNFYPQPQPNHQDRPIIPTEATEIADPTERAEISTTVKTSVPELIEPEILEVEEQPRRVSKKKQVKRPSVDEEDDDEQPRMPTGAFFPMFFGWGRNSGGAPGGATAVANAYSTGRGGVATSHATAYGMPTPDMRNFKDYKSFQPQQ